MFISRWLNCSKSSLSRTLSGGNRLKTRAAQEDRELFAPVARDLAHRKRMKVVPPGQGRPARSDYRTLETFPHHTLLAVHPLTGRTHQIRVHLAFIGCPVVADPLYGRRRPTIPLQRHFLHAHRLTITLPGETAPRTFVAPLPPELEEVLQRLRQAQSASRE